MRKRKSILLILLVLPLLLFMASAEESHGSPFKDFLGKAVNFFVLFGGLAYLLRKPMGSMLQARSDSLVDELEGAKKAHEEAARRLDEVESRVGKLDGEIEILMQEAESDGQSIQQRILQEAHKDADRLRQYAQSEIEMLTREAIHEIKEHTAAVAADQARQKIQEQMTDKFQSSFIDKSIKRLDKLHEKSNPDKTVRPGTH
jgi:F-type H+-transporting ATPase subunit b